MKFKLIAAFVSTAVLALAAFAHASETPPIPPKFLHKCKTIADCRFGEICSPEGKCVKKELKPGWQALPTGASAWQTLAILKKINKEINFEDPNLEKLVKDELKKIGIMPYKKVTVGQCKKLEFIVGNSCQLGEEPDKITSLKGLESCTGLNSMWFRCHLISDLGPLENLTKIDWLRLDYNQISDITALKNLKNLTYLQLSENQISDITALENLTKLANLNLDDNQISDIKALENLTNLTQLYLISNKISDITALEKLKNLTSLYLSSNQVSDIKALENLTKLADLSLGENQISDIKALENLTSLKWLGLGYNQISDIHALVVNAENGGLGEGDTVVLYGNPLNEVSKNSYIPKLKSFGIIVKWDVIETT